MVGVLSKAAFWWADIQIFFSYRYISELCKVIFSLRILLCFTDTALASWLADWLVEMNSTLKHTPNQTKQLWWIVQHLKAWSFVPSTGQWKNYSLYDLRNFFPCPVLGGGDNLMLVSNRRRPKDPTETHRTGFMV